MIVETPTPSWTVYAHISPNGKMYVGITSINLKHRWNSGRGYRYHPHLWSAIQKYGWENFQHEIIAYGLTREEAGHMEQLLINKLDLMEPKKGYNLTPGGEGA